jgi:hypothetical protein
MVSEWNKFVKKIYDQNKSKPGYKFKDALRDAAPQWKKMQKGSTSDDSAAAAAPMKTRKARRGKSRSRKSRRSRGRSRSRGQN